MKAKALFKNNFPHIWREEYHTIHLSTLHPPRPQWRSSCNWKIILCFFPQPFQLLQSVLVSNLHFYLLFNLYWTRLVPLRLKTSFLKGTWPRQAVAKHKVSEIVRDKIICSGHYYRLKIELAMSRCLEINCSNSRAKTSPIESYRICSHVLHYMFRKDLFPILIQAFQTESINRSREC